VPLPVSWMRWPPLPEGLVPGGPYNTPPSSDDEAIGRAIQDGQPEKIAGLSWSKPDFSGPDHKIIRVFDIDRKKRPGLECIPCAICSGSHPKFLDGAVLWSPDGWLRVIGHVCAAKPEHFGEARYRGLKKQRDQEELDNVALNWLHANIARFRPLVTDVNKLRESAVFWERQQQMLFRYVPEIARLLVDVTQKQDGQLTVVQKLSDTRLAAYGDADGGSNSRLQSQYELIRVGTLRGRPLLVRPRTKWVRQIDSVVEALNRIPAGIGDEPLLALFDQGEAGVTITAGLVFRNIQTALELGNKLADFEQFLSPDNLEELETWGRDARNTVRFSIQKTTSQITFVQSDRSRATLSLIFPKLPDLSPLNALAAAGLQLDKLLPKRGGQERDSEVSP
jgi:hypothetical protein